MVTLKRPEIKNITITIRDRKINKSRSVVVYDATLDEVFKKIQKCLK